MENYAKRFLNLLKGYLMNKHIIILFCINIIAPMVAMQNNEASAYLNKLIEHALKKRDEAE